MLEEAFMPAPSIFHSLFLSEFTVLDFAYVDAQYGVCGDSYFVSAELNGALDEKDFLLDFSKAKKTLKAIVDDAFDHKLLVPMGAGTASLAHGRLEIRAADGSAWSYECPREAFELFPDAEISAAVLQYHLSRIALSRLPANVREARFTLSSLPRFATEANFRYTHGLRQHDGNCQRLFHGHRNPVEAWVNGVRSADAEKLLAAEWHNAHFICAATLVNQAKVDLPLGRRMPKHPGTAEVEYRSAQGLFRGSLPASRAILVQSEPSIETMCALGVETLRAHGVQGELKVVAYEGLNKGATAISR